MLIEITYNVTDVYMSTTETPVYVEISFEQPGGTSAVWGSITGTLSNQTDLQNALNAKLDESTIDGGTEGQILSKASGTDFDFAWINNYAKYLATNVRNQTGSTIGAFQVVYISGATGNKPLVSLADADTEATSSKTYGVTATSIANNSTGDVVTAGELSGIDTSAFNEGDLLWLSTTAGGVVTSPPAEPAHAVFIGYVVRSHPTLGTIDVSIQNGYELNELHGVQITTPTDNQGLFYNATSTLWENKSITTALGYTPVPTTRNITINGVTYDLSADRTWTIAAGISGSGAAGQVTYWTGASAVSGSNNLFWDNANGRLGIGTNVPAFNLSIKSSTSVSTIHNQNNSTGGQYFITAGADSSYITGGASFNGTNWVAQATNAVLFGTFAGDVRIYANKSLTSGNIFTPSERFTIFGSTGNVAVNSTTDLSVRFGVIGDTLLRGSGNTSATTALTVQNSSSQNIITIKNNRTSNIISDAGQLNIASSADGTNGLMEFDANSSNTQTVFVQLTRGTVGFASTAINQTAVRINGGFAPTSGTATWHSLHVNPTINQTGGANGITRGLYVNPTLTSAADFRAIETTAGNVLFGSNFFWDNTNGRLGIGTNAPATVLQLGSSASRLRFNETAGGSIFHGIEFATSGVVYSSLLGNQSTGEIRLSTVASYFPTFYSSGAEAMRISTQRNLLIGFTTDQGTRLSVSGDTLLRGSGATSATTALTVQNSSSTNLFRVKNDGNTKIGNNLYDDGSSNLIIGINGSAARAAIANDSNYQDFLFVSTTISSGNINSWSFGQRRDTAFGNTIGSFQIIGAYVSNSGVFSTVGGGYRVPLICNPNGDVLINGGNANVVNGLIGLKVNAPTAHVDITASTTANASLRIRSGTAPTTPNDGDIWFDGTDIKMRIGGVTKTFTLI